MKYIDKIAEYLNIAPSELLDHPCYGKRLKEVRSEFSVELNTLSKETGIPEAKLSNYEQDIEEPSTEELKLIAQAYNVSLGDLLWSDLTASKRTDEGSTISLLSQDKIRMIPIFENVSAGFGAYACSDIIDYMPLYFQNPSDVPDTICIKVQGDSMYPKIEDGDIIVVRRQESVDSGSIAVVLVDEEQGYVKKVIYDRETIELHSINPEYAPKVFKGKDVLRVRVVGLVKKIVKEV